MGRTKKAPASNEAPQDPVIGMEPEADAAAAVEQLEETDTLECMITEYAVTAQSGLNLRAEPRMDGQILAVLPYGAGVYSYDKPTDGWLHVGTGRLAGWMLAEYLEELPLPELSACEPE